MQFNVTHALVDRLLLMERRTRGFSLMEVIVVIAIMLILTTIGFFAYGPMREKGLESSCMSNLRQIHAAITMYSDATDSTSAYPELHGLAYLPGKAAQDMAFPDQSILWCPAVPLKYRKRLGTSYASALWGSPVDANGAISQERLRVIDREKREGLLLRIVECTAHDELYYAPGEKDVNDRVASPFKIYLHVDGSVIGRRFAEPRDFPITGNPG